MARPWFIEGYAIVSADGMIADRDRHMPEGLKIEADREFFLAAIARADLIVHGRHSYEDEPGSERHRRLILTHQVTGTAAHPSFPNALLWNPAHVPYFEAFAAIGCREGLVAVTGGTDVFALFLQIGFDAFHLSRTTRVALPGGRPVFPQVPAETPEAVLAAHGLFPEPARVLDRQAQATVLTFRAPPGQRTRPINEAK